MHGSYRGIIFAIVGWLSLVGASPPGQEARREQQTESQSVADALQRIASSVEQSNEPDQATAPCRKGEDNRDSDLCAQWKAADGAASSALWTERTFYLGVVGLVIGFLTLVAAGAAAIYARRAAVATELTVKIAKDAAAGADQALEIANRNADAAVGLVQNQIALERGRLMIVGGFAEYVVGQTSIEFTLKVRNYGKSPVILSGVVCEHTAGLDFSDDAVNPLQRRTDVIDPQSSDEFTYIGPFHGFRNFAMFDYMMGYIEYDLVFGQTDKIKPCKSYFCFTFKDVSQDIGGAIFPKIETSFALVGKLPPDT